MTKGKARANPRRSRAQANDLDHGTGPAAMGELLRDDNLFDIHAWQMALASRAAADGADARNVELENSPSRMSARRENTPASFAVSVDSGSSEVAVARPDRTDAREIRRRITGMANEIGILRSGIEEAHTIMRLARARTEHVQAKLQTARRTRKVLEMHFFGVLKEKYGISPTGSKIWDPEESEAGDTSFVVGDEESSNGGSDWVDHEDDMGSEVDEGEVGQPVGDKAEWGFWGGDGEQQKMSEDKSGLAPPAGSPFANLVDYAALQAGPDEDSPAGYVFSRALSDRAQAQAPCSVMEGKIFRKSLGITGGSGETGSRRRKRAEERDVEAREPRPAKQRRV